MFTVLSTRAVSHTAVSQSCVKYGSQAACRGKHWKAMETRVSKRGFTVPEASLGLDVG